MSNPIFELPATFEMVVWCTDGEQIGRVTVSLPVGVYPSEEKIKEMMKEAEESVTEHGLHICDPHEFGEAYIYEETGQRLVIPGPNKWAAPYSK